MVHENISKEEAIVTQQLSLTTPIDIIVPAHNNGLWGLELTMSCIKNLYLYTQLPFHIIIVDDSNDLTPLWFTRLLKEKNNITYIHSDVPYKCGNQVFNIGLSHCKYEFVATVMNSATVQPDWELVAVEMLKRNPKIATVALKCLFPWGTIESAGIQLVEAGGQYGHIQDSQGMHTTGIFPVDIGANLPPHLLCNSYERQAVQWAFAIHRKEALVGNLEEDVFHGFKGWDDIDNCFVLRKKGWKIFYCGSGAGYHLPRATRGVEETDKEGIRLNQENGEIFRKRWGIDGKKPIDQLPAEAAKAIPGTTDKPVMNRAERRKMERVGKA